MEPAAGTKQRHQRAGRDYDHMDTCQVRRAWHAPLFGLLCCSLAALVLACSKTQCGWSLTRCSKARTCPIGRLVQSRLPLAKPRCPLPLQVCWDGGDLVCCDLCPCSYHAECVGSTPAEMERTTRWACPHHSCYECGRNTQQAGGMLMRCEVRRWRAWQAWAASFCVAGAGEGVPKAPSACRCYGWWRPFVMGGACADASRLPPVRRCVRGRSARTTCPRTS